MKLLFLYLVGESSLAMAGRCWWRSAVAAALWLSSQIWLAGCFVPVGVRLRSATPAYYRHPASGDAFGAVASPRAVRSTATPTTMAMFRAPTKRRPIESVVPPDPPQQLLRQPRIAPQEAAAEAAEVVFGANPCNIKVIGVGGGGGNAVDRMVETGIMGVEVVGPKASRCVRRLSRSSAPPPPLVRSAD